MPGTMLEVATKKLNKKTDQTLFNACSKTDTIFSKCAMSKSQSES